jgi:hypothetical protein
MVAVSSFATISYKNLDDSAIVHPQPTWRSSCAILDRSRLRISSDLLSCRTSAKVVGSGD